VEMMRQEEANNPTKENIFFSTARHEKIIDSLADWYEKRSIPDLISSIEKIKK
jgi:hypothetical protein